MKLKFHRLDSYSVYKGKLMQVLTPEGSRVDLSAVDADGLPIAVPGTPAWSVSDPASFTLTAAADGLSATLVPTGATAAGTVTVTAADLSVTADISFTSVAPVEKVATKLNLVFTAIPPVLPPTTPAA